MPDEMVQLGGVNLRAYSMPDGAYILATQNATFPLADGQMVISGTAPLQLPNRAVKYAYFKAGGGNGGTIYLGGTPVVVAAGTADTAAGMELASGDISPWMPIDNLNRLHHVASAQNQKLFIFYAADE